MSKVSTYPKRQKDSAIWRFVDILTKRYNFSPSQVKVNPTISVAGGSMSPDILVYGRDQQARLPLLIVEVKSKLDHIYEQQLFEYLNTSGATYGALYDGIDTVFYKKISDTRFVEVPDIPKKGEGQIMLSKESLKTPHSIAYKFARIAATVPQRHYYRYPVPNTIDSILAVQKILLCKLVDETNPSPRLLFYTFPLKDGNDKLSDEFHTVNRINELFELVKMKYPNIFHPKDELNLSTETIMAGVLEFQSYSICKADKRLLQESYEFLIETLIERENLVNSYQGGIYFTPKPIADFIIRLLRPTETSTVFDPAMGLGNFLLGYLDYFRKNANKKQLLSMASFLYGVEMNKSVVQIARVNMILLGYESANIFLNDRSFNNNKLLHVEKVGFDIIVSNPPRRSHKQYLTYLRRFKFTPENESGYIDSDLLELGLKFLKPGGRMAMFSSIHLLFSEKGLKMREYLLHKGLLKGIVEFPSGAPFQHNTVSFIVLLLEKPNTNAKLSGDNIFMANISGLQKSYSEFFETIITKYEEFDSGKAVKPVHDPTIFVVNSSNLRNTSWVVEYQFHLFKKRNLKMMQLKLSDIAGVIAGTNTHITHANERTEEKVPLIYGADIVDEEINYEDIRYVQPKTIPRSEKYTIQLDDILISTAGTIGKLALLTEPYHERLIAGSHVAILRAKKEIVHPKFLYYVLKSRFVTDQFNAYKTKSIADFLSIERLKEIEVPIPPIQKQLEIIERLSNLGKKRYLSTSESGTIDYILAEYSIES